MTRLSRGSDIRERTFQFGVRIVQYANCLPRTAAGFELARQVIRSGTSVGANVEEGDAAESKNDFVHKMSIALKEAQETRYWLRILIESGMGADDPAKALLQESDELVRILNTIISKTIKGMTS